MPYQMDISFSGCNFSQSIIRDLARFAGTGDPELAILDQSSPSLKRGHGNILRAKTSLCGKIRSVFISAQTQDSKFAEYVTGAEEDIKKWIAAHSRDNAELFHFHISMTDKMRPISEERSMLLHVKDPDGLSEIKALALIAECGWTILHHEARTVLSSPGPYCTPHPSIKLFFRVMPLDTDASSFQKLHTQLERFFKNKLQEGLRILPHHIGEFFEAPTSHSVDLYETKSPLLYLVSSQSDRVGLLLADTCALLHKAEQHAATEQLHPWILYSTSVSGNCLGNSLICVAFLPIEPQKTDLDRPLPKVESKNHIIPEGLPGPFSHKRGRHLISARAEGRGGPGEFARMLDAIYTCHPDILEKFELSESDHCESMAHSHVMPSQYALNWVYNGIAERHATLRGLIHKRLAGIGIHVRWMLPGLGERSPITDKIA